MESIDSRETRRAALNATLLSETADSDESAVSDRPLELSIAVDHEDVTGGET